MIGIKRFGDKTSITAAFAALTILLLAPAAARAQWTTPDAGGNINSTNTGNVGVGTTSPTSKLDVSGTAAVSGDLKVADNRLKFTFGGPEGYVQGATERLSFWTTNGSGGQAVRMRFGGNAATSTAEFLNVSSVQLGTGVRFALGITAPEGTLDVRGGVAASGNGLPIILSAQQGAGSGIGGNVIINAGPNGPTGATGQIIFGIGGGINAGNLITGEKMRITDAGNVGIGTSAPLQKFQLGTNTPTPANAPDAISLGATYSSAAGANPKLRLYDDNGTSVYGLGVSASQFDFMMPTGARYVWNVNGVETMRLDTSGNLGIGKTAGASYKLDVNGNINGAGLCIGGVCKNDWSQVGGGTTTIGAANISFGQFGSSVGGGNFSFPASVGIGTATPDKLFTVQGQIASQFGVMSVIRTTGPNTGYGLALDATGTGNNNLGFLANGVNKASMAWDLSRHFLGFVNMEYNGTDFGLRLNQDGSLTYHDSANGNERFRVTASGNVGIGKNNPGVALDVAGAINATGAITGATVNATYQDVAEWVPSTQKLSAGTVVVLDTYKTNHVIASTAAYDTKVAGVVSEKPGIALGEGGEDKALIATTGRVRVKVDATRAPIRVGDLLVTSDVEGVAMKSEPIEIGGRKIHAPGTIIGKALEPLASGMGEILVLLSLQ